MAFPTSVFIAFTISTIFTGNIVAAGKFSKQDITSNQCEQEGYYGSEINCSSFYRCVEDSSLSGDGQKVFKRIDFECPPGTIFDEKTKLCNYPERVNSKPGCMYFTQDEEEIETGYPGLPGMKCDEYAKSSCGGASGCNFTDPNNIFYQACDKDCKNNHNAVRGVCNKQDFCSCGPALKSVNSKSVSCKDIKHAEVYETLCHEDCQCVHNAVGGGCNFYTKACECGESVGKNAKNQCPHKTSNEFFLHAIAKYESIGIDIMKLINGPRQASL